MIKKQGMGCMNGAMDGSIKEISIMIIEMAMEYFMTTRELSSIKASGKMELRAMKKI